MGEIHAQIFEIHRMMLEDEDYCSSVSHIIHTQRVNAEYAVLRTSDSFSQMFSTMTDEYMQARAADVVDISNRLIRCLNGGNEESLLTRGPVILVAEDLTPSETVQLDKEKILAFLTLRGSENSHTAILARTMAIPAVVGLGQLDPAMEGKTAIVDGFTGTVCIDPDAEAIAAYTRKKQQEEEKHRLWQSLRGKSNTTRDGRSIRLYANIGGLDDISAALQNDAGASGLFMTNFSFAGATTCCPRRRSSSGHNGKQRRNWRESPSSSAPWTSGRTSRLIIFICPRRKIRRWGIEPSGSVCRNRSCSVPSCVPCTGQGYMGICPSCSL